jgi:hypothetical protein
MELGQYDQAASWLTRSIETGTPIILTQAYLASALALAGRLQEAQDSLSVFLAKRPGTTLAHFLDKDRRNGAEIIARNSNVYEGLRIAGLPR